MSRFVIISDTHIHPWAAFARGEGRHNSRLQRTLAVVRESLKRACLDDLPWLFAGDLIHTAGYALHEVMAGVTRVLADYPSVPKVIIWGNHDATNKGRIEVDNTVLPSLLKAVPQLILLTPGEVFEHAGVSVRGVGYQPRQSFLDLGPSEFQSDIGLYHQTVRGSESPHGFAFDEGIDPEALLRRHRVSIVGHVHHPQELNNTPVGQAILIPGSPEHHNFGDHGAHGWWILDLSNRSDPAIEFHPGGSPEFRTVDTPADLPGEVDGHFYRVRTVPEGAAGLLPADVTVMAPSVTTVHARDLLKGAADAEQILQAWMRTQAPSAGVDRDAVLAAGRELLATQDPVRLRPVIAAELVLHNFGSYGDATLRIQQGTWLVTGQGRDFPSNGSGKSTLVGEALYWLLFGKNTKGMGADEVIRRGQSECMVTATLIESLDHPDDDVQVPFRITRRRGTGGHTLEVEQDGRLWLASSVNEMTAKLGKYLGLTPEMYQNLAYFSQEKLLLFSSATDGERKEVLADLVGLSAYQQAAVVAGARIGDGEKQLAALEATVTAHTELYAQEQKQLVAKLVVAQQWHEAHEAAMRRTQCELNTLRADSSVAHAHQRLVVIHDTVQELLLRQQVREQERIPALVQQIIVRLGQAITVQVTVAEQEYQAVVGPFVGGALSVDSIRAAVATLSVEQAAVLQLEEQVRACTVQMQHAAVKLTEGQIELRQLDIEKARAEELYQQLQIKGTQGVCVTCGQAISPERQAQFVHNAQDAARVAEERSAAHTVDVTSRTEDVASLRGTLAEVSMALEQARMRVQALIDLRMKLVDIDQKAQRLSHLQLQAEQLTSAAQREAEQEIRNRITIYEGQMRGRVLRARTIVQRIETLHQANIAALEAGLAREQNTQNPHSNEVVTANQRISQLISKITQGQQQAAALRQDVVIYGYWRHGFSKQGLQSLLVEEIATLFNAARSDIFPLLTQGVYDVQFSTMSWTAVGEAREKTEFLIFEHGVLVPYGSLSGGQRRRVDVGIMLVLVVAVARWMRVPGVLGLLILDEVFGFLDASGAEGLQGALAQVQSVIPTIYVVTHDTHLQALFPNVIQVAQDSDGVSSLVS